MPKIPGVSPEKKAAALPPVPAFDTFYLERSISALEGAVDGLQTQIDGLSDQITTIMDHITSERQEFANAIRELIAAMNGDTKPPDDEIPY